jgi:hypothetical protein
MAKEPHIGIAGWAEMNPAFAQKPLPQKTLPRITLIFQRAT